MNPLEARRDRLMETVRNEWDSEAQLEARLRPNGLVEMVVVSTRFEGVAGSDREGEFWSTFRDTPREDLIFMAYCLLLTPEEAQHYQFSEASTNA